MLQYIRGGDHMYTLQNRWKWEKTHLQYYGLRNREHMFQNKIRLSAKQASIIEKLPCPLTEDELKTLKPLLGVQVVPLSEQRKTPTSLEEAHFCKNCVANNYIIPGLELDENGLCPMCQTKEETAHLKSVVPVMNTFPRAKHSRFDVALFYTGGKDSTYLLYYLAKVQGLRVLALTWEIPYMSESARKSIEGAKKTLDSVEFITRKIANDDLKTIYRYLYTLSENTCACPSLAYILFYPELVENRVPYFIAGNEPAQMMGLYYNHMAPKLAYTFGANTALHALINVGRVLSLHPPFKEGQFHTLATMKQLAYGENLLQNVFGYQNTLVKNIVEAIHRVPMMVKPLKRAIRKSSWSGRIPAFVQVDLHEISGGIYDWNKIKDIIVRECGWVAPEESIKGLHTSCQIEKCKEYSQFQRFYHMRSTMIPFSALELSIAVRDGSLSREEAMRELTESLGFSLEEIAECAIMKEYLKA